MAVKEVAFSESRMSVLTEQERSMSGFTHKFVINASDINNSAWTDDDDDIDVDLMDTPEDWAVLNSVVNVTTAFTATSALTLEVGTDGNPDNFIEAENVKAAGPIVGAAGGVPETLAGSFADASDTLVARFLCDSNGAPANISTGQAVIFLTLKELNKYHQE